MAERYYLLVYQEDGEVNRSFFVVSPKGEPVGEKEDNVRILLENMVQLGVKRDLITSTVPEDVLSRVRETYEHPEYVKRIGDTD